MNNRSTTSYHYHTCSHTSSRCRLNGDSLFGVLSSNNKGADPVLVSIFYCERNYKFTLNANDSLQLHCGKVGVVLHRDSLSHLLLRHRPNDLHESEQYIYYSCAASNHWVKSIIFRVCLKSESQFLQVHFTFSFQYHFCRCALPSES